MKVTKYEPSTSKAGEMTKMATHTAMEMRPHLFAFLESLCDVTGFVASLACSYQKIENKLLLFFD